MQKIGLLLLFAVLVLSAFFIWTTPPNAVSRSLPAKNIEYLKTDESSRQVLYTMADYEPNTVTF